MFKRINKRIRKREKDEADGVEDDQVLAAHDTDSDESDSGSSSEGSVNLSESEDEGFQEAGKRKRDESDEEGSVGSEGSEEEESEGEEEEEDLAPPMTVTDALSDPLYPAPEGSDARLCIICPGKELKHAKMISVHVASSTHLRRMKRFETLASRVGDGDEDPRLLVAALDESVRMAPREKTEPRVPRKDRRSAKRQRRRERKAANETPTGVIETKIATKKDESVKKHKLANRQHKTARLES